MNLVYSIERSPRRRKLTITVERDRRVVVHAPEGTPEEKIQQILESRRQWIYEKSEHSQKYRDFPHPPGKELVSGESALYLGRQYRIEIIEGNLDEVKFVQRFLIPEAQRNRMKEALREWYLGRAEAKIVPRVKAFARSLGVAIAGIRIVDNRYSWGSCTPKDYVHFNWRLIKAPMPVIDYVIVHELTHLMEANHTPEFWNIVRAQMPTMEKAKAWLKEHGQLLEQEI